MIESRTPSSPGEFSDVPIDAVRDFWNARPCNIRHSTQPIGSREYFDEVEARKRLVEPHVAQFAAYENWRDKRVLEIGCGIGTDTIGFLRAGARVTAVDLSSESLALARKRAVVYGFQENVQFYEANAERLTETVPVESYDLIYSFGVLHHTPHPEQAFDELRKYAKPGTTLKVMMYHTVSWKVFWVVLTYGRGRFWDWKRIVASNSEAQTGCPVTYTYTTRELTKLLERRGFRVRDSRVEHIFPYRIRDYVQYRYKKEWYFAWMPRVLFNWLQRRLGWHLCVTAEAV
jgi:ubiquinone/menaquinone biosynthesis C-methylase UbiE